MKTIELTLTSGPFGDGCSIYSFIPKAEHLTIREFVEDVLSDTRNWGCIRIPFKGASYYVEYSDGCVVSGEFPSDLYDEAVTGGSAYGGWSRMDYFVDID